MTDCITCPKQEWIESELKSLFALIKEKEDRVAGEVKKLCLLLEERQKQLEIRFSANKEAIESARSDMERRLLGMNEFREQLTNQAASFATRVELKSEAEKLDLKLAPLVRSSLTREGSTKWSDYLIMAIISGAIVLLAKLMHL